MMREIQKVLQVTPEGKTLLLEKNKLIFILTRNLQITAAHDFFTTPTSTQAQTIPLFWPPRSGSWKGRQKYRPKGQCPRNNNKQQPNNQQCGKFKQTIYAQI